MVYENWLEVRSGKLEHSPFCDRRLTVMLEPLEDAGEEHAYRCFWRVNPPSHFTSKTVEELAKLTSCPSCGDDLPEVMVFHSGSGTHVFDTRASYSAHRIDG